MNINLIRYFSCKVKKQFGLENELEDMKIEFF